MAKDKRKRQREPIVEPTAEQFAGGAFTLEDVSERQAGGSFLKLCKAWRRKPMIATLLANKVITYAEYRALAHYRHHADLADRSPLQDSIAKLMRGRGQSGIGPIVSTINASYIVRDCEAAVGALVDILRAVVVDDVSLSQWAMARHGAAEKCRTNPKGVRVCRLEPNGRALEIAKAEIKAVAEAVHGRLAA